MIFYCKSEVIKPELLLVHQPGGETKPAFENPEMWVSVGGQSGRGVIGELDLIQREFPVRKHGGESLFRNLLRVGCWYEAQKTGPYSV